MISDLVIKGQTEDNKPCEISINFNEKFIHFEAAEHICAYSIDDDQIEEIQNIKKDHLTIKGQSTYIDCKAKLHFDQHGKLIKAKFASKFFLSPLYQSVECHFTEQ